MNAAAPLPGTAPAWDAGPEVGAWMSERSEGPPPYGGFNLGDHVGDDPAAVRANRERLAAALGARPVWLRQVHGTRVLRVGVADAVRAEPPEADGAFTTEPGVACAVGVADCLPLLLAAPGGRGVAALHAGWRGLAGGIVEAGVAALSEAAGCAPSELAAWLGPCIGPQEFEVGAEVLPAFGREARAQDQPAFAFRPRPDGSPRWRADLPALARERLQRAGVRQIAGGGDCTVTAASRFFSYRRDGVCGRMAALVWLRR